MFVHVQNCVRDAPAGTELWTCWCYEYKTVTALPVRWLVRRMRIQKKYDIENQFSGTQMFVQAKNKNVLNTIDKWYFTWRKDSICSARCDYQDKNLLYKIDLLNNLLHVNWYRFMCKSYWLSYML